MAKTFDYLTLDPGTEYLRFAYVDDHGHPEPIIVTNNGGDRQFSTMIAMKRPPLFQKKAYFSDVRLIVADAFRAEQKYVDGISFYAKRKNDSYEIPSIGKQVGNDMRGHEQVEVMQMILKNTSSMINDQLKNKRIYICVPDACSISHRRKLRKALELVSESYQEGRNKKVEANSIVFIQQSAAVAQMAFHWIGRNVSVTNGSGLEIPPRRIIVAISFGAGHFSAGAYEQRSYERCGIVRLCGSGDNQLGGEDLNLKLGEWCMNHKDIQPYAEELKKNKRLLKFYRKTMETVKTDLSELEQTLADIEVEENNVKSVEISRKNFEKACEEIFERIKKHLYNISDYLKENELHCTHVIYAGGSTRVIQFRKIVKELFEKPQIIESINPDECQVLGTGLKAGIKDGIHGLAYAECRDTAMDDHYIEIMRTTGKKVKLYLTKKGESVQNLPERWIKTIDGSEGVPYPGDDNKNLEKKAKELKWIPDVESDVRLMIQDYPKDACDRKVTDNEEKVNAIVPTGPQGDANSHFDTQINTQDYPIKGILQQGLHQGSHQPYQEKNDLETQYQVNHSSNPTYSLHQSENNVLGIDLGTTKIVCATCKIGDFKPEILTFNNGSRTLSSFVEFDKYRNCTSYGDQALSNLERNPGYILYDAKRMIGQAYSDKLKLHSAYWSFNIKENNGRPVYILPKKMKISPEQVTTELLNFVKRTAQDKFKEYLEVKDCVITVPAYFTMRQKQATIDAAKQARLNVLSLMTEPMAAVYSHGFDYLQEGSILFVFNLGGGTFDVSIIKLENGQLVMKYTDGDSNLGGRDFDNIIFEFLRQTINNKPNYFGSSKDRARLMKKSEDIKIKLSQHEIVEFGLEEFGERQRLKITQEKFKEWTMGLTDTITHICQRALKNIRMSSFDKVLFIGGASRMKIIKDLVREIIPCQVHDEQDEVIAIGAAIRAAQLKDPAHKNEKHFIEILPIGVGIGLAKNQYSIMVNRGTHFPTKIEKQYSTSINNQEVVHIAVYEGERLLADRNRKLGEVYLKGLPRGPAREVHIDVTFEFDQNGILTVHAKSKNGREMRFTIDYKALRKEGEPIEDLLRQIQSYRIDSDGQQIIDNAKHKLLENIEYIRHRISHSASPESLYSLKIKCNEIQDCFRKKENLFSISTKIQDLEKEAKIIFTPL